MDEWFSLFAASVWRYLDGLGGARPELPPTASDARKLGAAWRALLRMHDTNAQGECVRCKRGHPGSCTVWQVAVGYFVRRPPGKG
ncbi:MAG: hypothetical protein GEU86_17970 [Actinophytocola sp.]|nr:hypothetical protein [Actinophytocola sp.]